MTKGREEKPAIADDTPAHIRIAADGGANALYEAAGQHGDSSFVCTFPSPSPVLGQ
jgi:thiamine pyrophosphokinase